MQKMDFLVSITELLRFQHCTLMFQETTSQLTNRYRRADELTYRPCKIALLLKTWIYLFKHFTLSPVLHNLLVQFIIFAMNC